MLNWTPNDIELIMWCENVKPEALSCLPCNVPVVPEEFPFFGYIGTEFQHFKSAMDCASTSLVQSDRVYVCLVPGDGTSEQAVPIVHPFLGRIRNGAKVAVEQIWPMEVSVRVPGSKGESVPQLVTIQASLPQVTPQECTVLT